MTISEYVERRGLMLRYLAIAMIAVGIAALFIFPDRVFPIRRRQWSLLAVPVLLLYGFLAMTTKCPRCRGSLGESINAAAIPFSSDVPNACPHCGVSFNESMEVDGGKP